MMRFGTLMGCVAALVLVLTAAASAELDRSDLMDVDGGYSDDDLYSYSYLSLFIEQYETTSGSFEGGFASAQLEAYRSHSNGWVDLFFFLYEPDRVTRKSGKADMTQSNEVGVLASWSLSSPSTSATYSTSTRLDNALEITGCKGQVKASNGSPDDAPQSVKWTIQCKKKLGALLDELGVPGGVQDKFAEAFGIGLGKSVKLSGRYSD